jgi:hypothetical protein
MPGAPQFRGILLHQTFLPLAPVLTIDLTITRALPSMAPTQSGASALQISNAAPLADNEPLIIQFPIRKLQFQNPENILKNYFSVKIANFACKLVQSISIIVFQNMNFEFWKNIVGVLDFFEVQNISLAVCEKSDTVGNNCIVLVRDNSED